MGGDDNEVSEYLVKEQDGTERNYLLTAEDAKARGATPVGEPEAKAATPKNKQVKPTNK